MEEVGRIRQRGASAEFTRREKGTEGQRDGREMQGICERGVPRHIYSHLFCRLSNSPSDMLSGGLDDSPTTAKDKRQLSPLLPPSPAVATGKHKMAQSNLAMVDAKYP